jgi:limonene-1,2-epoxide hydrolase
MNERTDRLKMNGSWVELPVMGVYEFRDGKISAWRDYFDMGPFQQA